MNSPWRDTRTPEFHDSKPVRPCKWKVQSYVLLYYGNYRVAAMRSEGPWVVDTVVGYHPNKTYRYEHVDEFPTREEAKAYVEHTHTLAKT